MNYMFSSPTSGVTAIPRLKAKRENPLRCSKCNSAVTPRASRCRMLIDFLLLYFIGLYELLRQWLIATRIDHNHIVQLLTDIDLHKPIIVISGVTSGLGGELMRHFLATSAHVIALGYEPRPVFHRKCTMLTVDFESAASTFATANKLVAELRNLPPGRDVIFVHCAAVYNPYEGNSSNPVERTLLINTFLPVAFIETISSVLSGVICIGSSSQRVSPRLEQRCILDAAQTPYAAYPFSKILGLAHMIDWGLRSAKPCIVIHPGIVATNLYKNEPGIIGATLRLFVSCSAWDAETSALRIFQVLRASRFFDKIWFRSMQQDFVENLYSDDVYWDSVTISAASIPWQVSECHPQTLTSHMLQVMKNNFFEHFSVSQ